MKTMSSNYILRQIEDATLKYVLVFSLITSCKAVCKKVQALCSSAEDIYPNPKYSLSYIHQMAFNGVINMDLDYLVIKYELHPQQELVGDKTDCGVESVSIDPKPDGHTVL